MNVPYNGTVIKRGSHGDPVFACKRALKAAGHGEHLQPNKIFGIFAERNTKAFQAERGLTADGQIGEQTLAALDDYFDMYGYYLYTGVAPGGGLVLPAKFTPTHDTAGLPGFPSIDCFQSGGTIVRAPEACELVWPHFINWSQAKHVGGWTCYLQADSGDTYFDTHFGSLEPAGHYAKGARIGVVASVPRGWWPDHIHHGKHKGRYDPGV